MGVNRSGGFSTKRGDNKWGSKERIYNDGKLRIKMKMNLLFLCSFSSLGDCFVTVTEQKILLNNFFVTFFWFFQGKLPHRVQIAIQSPCDLYLKSLTNKSPPSTTTWIASERIFQSAFFIKLEGDFKIRINISSFAIKCERRGGFTD